MSALGISAGGLVHVTAAAVGLSALIVSSATAFTVVKYAGAAYLIVLGLRRLLARDEPPEAAAGLPERSLRRIFWQGAIVNVLNPKTALFFLAFLPQFVDPDAGAVALQVTVLGLMFVAIALVCDSGWGLAAGSAAGWLQRAGGLLRAQRYAPAACMVGLGVAAALTGRKA